VDYEGLGDRAGGGGDVAAEVAFLPAWRGGKGYLAKRMAPTRLGSEKQNQFLVLRLRGYRIGDLYIGSEIIAWTAEEGEDLCLCPLLAPSCFNQERWRAFKMS